MVTFVTLISNAYHFLSGVRWQTGSSLTPAPYEKAQASDVICKRAAHSGRGCGGKAPTYCTRLPFVTEYHAYTRTPLIACNTYSTHARLPFAAGRHTRVWRTLAS